MTKKADFIPTLVKRAASLNLTKDLPRLSSPINREDASPDLPNLDLDADCKLFGDVTDC